jgi:hypothetical protein
MATIYELSDPYGNYLLPVLPRGQGVCSECKTSVTGTWRRCRACNTAAQELPHLADAIGLVSLAPKSDQLDHELRYYKSDSTFPSRKTTESGLSAVLWRWLKTHETCVATRAGATEFPIVTTIPSTKGRRHHPLREMVQTRIGVTRDRYKSILEPNRDFPEDRDRDFSTDRFFLSQAVPLGVPVLIIDDTFTSGSRTQSAAALLKSTGSGPVGVVCIGRHFVPSQNAEYGIAAREYLRRSNALGWDWDFCSDCDAR